MPRSAASRGLSVALVEEDDFAAAPLGALPGCVRRAAVSGTREFGPVDAMKPRSCLTLFARAAPGEPVFGQVLGKYFGGISDPVTEQRL